MSKSTRRFRDSAASKRQVGFVQTVATPETNDDDGFLKACLLIGGGALALPALAGMTGIGIVGTAFGAVGMSALELGVIGAAAGATAAYVDAEKTEATKAKKQAVQSQAELKSKIEKAKQVLKELEA